eukprot:CAMPEP_0197563962 /NCGR_PEP_ID=MMETSP1320-20131121/29622_1 /TAXON_ID=91990 /ORGANISM="Bolidomonas sp., Strain RCC2347" /LENGTH=213 /DNA_ID=CAMNT_0043125839 /DNA_START=6 /DNA_END=643 /DNA_ORIENTATION=-
MDTARGRASPSPSLSSMHSARTERGTDKNLMGERAEKVPSYVRSNKLNHFDDMKSQAERRRKEVREVMKVTGATKKEVLEFREIFELVDADKGGSIDARELKKLTALMNMEMSETELDDMIMEIDNSGTGEIIFLDFVRCMLKKPDIDYTIDDVQEAFRTLAGKGQPAGKIPQKVLMEHLCNVGFENEKLSKDRVEEILAMSEIDVKGFLDYG